MDETTKRTKSDISNIEVIVVTLMAIVIIGGSFVLGLRFGFGIGA